MWNPKTREVSIAISALGAELLRTEYLALNEVMTRKGDRMQQTTHILRKVLSI